MSKKKLLAQDAPGEQSAVEWARVAIERKAELPEPVPSKKERKRIPYKAPVKKPLWK